MDSPHPLFGPLKCGALEASRKRGLANSISKKLLILKNATGENFRRERHYINFECIGIKMRRKHLKESMAKRWFDQSFQDCFIIHLPEKNRR